MSKYAELMGLDSEAVLTIAETYSGYAAAREATELSGKNREWIASSWLIGALFQSLIEPEEAKPMFAQAAWHYSLLKMPIWRVCQLCAGKKRDRINEQISTVDYVDSEDVFYQELQLEFNSRKSKKAKSSFFQDQEIELFGIIPNLNIPYQLIIQAINDSHTWEIENSANNLQSFKQVIRRLNEITEIYRSDEYYWQNLQGQFIPYEPAALAICMVFVKKWLNTGNNMETLLKNTGLRKQQSILLEIASDLLEKPD